MIHNENDTASQYNKIHASTWNSSDTAVTDYGLDGWVQFWEGEEIFHITMSRLAQGPTQSSYKMGMDSNVS
jgi:hypothetical protein